MSGGIGESQQFKDIVLQTRKHGAKDFQSVAVFPRKEQNKAINIALNTHMRVSDTHQVRVIASNDRGQTGTPMFDPGVVMETAAKTAGTPVKKTATRKAAAPAAKKPAAKKSSAETVNYYNEDTKQIEPRTLGKAK